MEICIDWDVVLRQRKRIVVLKTKEKNGWNNLISFNPRNWKLINCSRLQPSVDNPLSFFLMSSTWLELEICGWFCRVISQVMSRMDYWKARKSTVTVLYSYVYDNRHQRVCISEGERLILIEKTNSDWWQVIFNSSNYFHIYFKFICKMWPISGI